MLQGRFYYCQPYSIQFILSFDTSLMTKRSVTSFPKAPLSLTSCQLLIEQGHIFLLFSSSFSSSELYEEPDLIKAHFVRRIITHKTNQKINLAVVGWKSQQQKVSLVSIFHK